MTGEALFLASDEERFQEYKRLADLQKFRGSLDQLRTMDQETLFQTILCVGMHSRLKEHEEGRPKKQSVGGVFVCDLDHHPGTQQASKEACKQSQHKEKQEHTEKQKTQTEENRHRFIFEHVLALPTESWNCRPDDL